MDAAEDQLQQIQEIEEIEQGEEENQRVGQQEVKDHDEEAVREFLHKLSKVDAMPVNHVKFLTHLKNELGFEPNVCYDIGASATHWTRAARRVWPSAEYVLFDAFEPTASVYEAYGLRYHIGVLSDQDGRIVKYYQNDLQSAGNSYYKENNDTVFPPERFFLRETEALDAVVARRGFPSPDLIKLDVQGSELDIFKGAQATLEKARYLIVELQHVEYNQGAPMADETTAYLNSIGWECIAPRFQDNGPDADYCFVNTRHPSYKTPQQTEDERMKDLLPYLLRV